jgi:hypothetical protein
MRLLADAMLVYCGGGSLKSFLEKFQKRSRAILEGDAAIITAQIGSALEFLHAQVRRAAPHRVSPRAPRGPAASQIRAVCRESLTGM